MENKRNYKDYISVSISILALVVAGLGYWLAIDSHNYQTKVENRRLIVDVLKELKEIQNEFQKSQFFDQKEKKPTEEEILLLNYYQVLEKLLADKIGDEQDLFKWAHCNHESSVRLRIRPSPRSTQIGGIARDERVVVLGEYSYNKKDTWYFVVSLSQKKIGWAYKFFNLSR